jgi:hypothetical protein
MNNDQGTEVFCYDIFVDGVFGRNRKAKREMFSVGKHLPAKLELSVALNLMDAKLKDLKFKGAYSYMLKERRGFVKNEGGFEIYTTNIFGDSIELRRGTVDVTPNEQFKAVLDAAVKAIGSNDYTCHGARIEKVG